jgi:hypothetical protein
MKASRRVITVTIISGLLSCLATTPVVSESKKTGNRSGGHQSLHMADKIVANSSAQWSADPKKGWVRAEERHKEQERRESTSKFKSNNGRQKSGSGKDITSDGISKGARK